MHNTLWHITLSSIVAGATYMGVLYGVPWYKQWFKQREMVYDRVLNQHLLLDISPKLAVAFSLILIGVGATFGFGATEDIIGTILGGLSGLLLPPLALKYLNTQRNEKLEAQLIDGITVLSSGMRAGLNLGQAFELLVKNTTGPIHQEFNQLIREYQMGLDLTHAMHNAANRIGLQNYRLLFTALEMHRQRGGDTAKSLDRIAESVREIQRLEGKLDALTSKGRSQAWMMAVMPVVFL
ncbi:MAG: type II secretion system F family protein, partial [Phycisphaeraceae bacterium]|nr:type II secretion system F family protein [Phycisphaeraceae bacterium]